MSDDHTPAEAEASEKLKEAKRSKKADAETKAKRSKKADAENKAKRSKKADAETKAKRSKKADAETKAKNGYLSSIDGTLLSRTAGIVFAACLILGGLTVWSMRSLSGSAADAESVEALADQISSTSSRLLLIAGAVTVLFTVAAAAIGAAMARKVTAPMLQLRDAARATSTALPDFVEACEAGGEVPPLPTVEVQTGGIASDIANSLNEMQRTAANLAVTQTYRRTRDGERFVDLGLQTERLLADQMRYIEAMEQDETSAANLQRLFRVDHLASRMRRNAASMLVLADRDTRREFPRPVSIHQVVQAASSGIEHFERVAMSDLSGVAVNGAIAADLAHLLAELLDAATTSSTDAMTDVAGRPIADGYILQVIDHGTSLEPNQINEINQGLADPARADATPTTLLSHAVVARLAQRHGVRVQFAATESGGTVAQVALPQIVLARLARTEPTPATPGERDTAPAQPVATPPAPSAAAEVAPAETLAEAIPPVLDAVPADLSITETEPFVDHAASTVEDLAFDVESQIASSPEPLADLAPATPVAPVAVPEATPAPSPTASSEDEIAADLAERWRGLASGQRAAIEWAMDINANSASIADSGLRPGPVSAATLAELDPTPMDD